MAPEPTVSVLMGVHNEAAYIEEAVNSILEQTYSEFEFIIVDDASTDKTLDILQAYDDERLLILKNESNQGLTPSLNHALSVSRGQYIARQDADDISEPQRLERQVDFLEANEDFEVVGTGAHLIDESGKQRSQRRVHHRPTFDRILTKNRIIHGSVMIRKEPLEQLGGYDEFFRYGQDIDLWLRLAKEHRLANIPEPLYNLRMHDESVYFDRKDTSALYSIFARKCATDQLSDATEERIRSEGIEALYEELTDGERAGFHRDLAVRYLRYGHTAQARDEVSNAFDHGRFDPRTWALLILSLGGSWPTKTAIGLARLLLNTRYSVSNRLANPDSS